MPIMRDNTLMLDSPQYRLASGVQIVRREKSVLLVSAGSSIRISPGAMPLLPLLSEGCSGSALEHALQQRHPQADGIALRLQAFLEPLLRSGMLSAGGAVSARRGPRASLPLFSPDPLAHWLSRQVLRVPARLRQATLLALLMAAVAGVVQLALAGSLLQARAMVDQVNIGALLVFGLLVVPLHEAGHALACRMAGAPVGPAGILLHGYVVPGPYVETTQAYLVPDRWSRFWIPAAGPVVNLLSAGAAAWVATLAAPGSALQAGAVYLAMLGLMWVYFDTNPFGPTDGSHMLEAVLEDEMARRNAFGFRVLRPEERPRAIRYRIVAGIHMVIGSGLLYLWLR
jgi:hypothetical protein